MWDKLDILSKKAGWWEVFRGAVWRESHGITEARPGLGVLAEVTSSMPLPSAAHPMPAELPLDKLTKCSREWLS